MAQPPVAASATFGRRGTVGLDTSIAPGSLETASLAPGLSIKEIFEKFDVDGNGEIDLEELLSILQVLDPVLWSRDNVLKLWSVVDADDDGVITYEEFTDWLTKPKRPINFDKDDVFSPDTLLEVALNFDCLDSSLSLKEVISDEELEKTLSRSALCHAYGGTVESQKLGDERPWIFSVGGREFPSASLPVGVACQKGCKGAVDTAPNQDNFSITYFKNGYIMACAFDGHGTDGHKVATRTVQTVPYFLAKSWEDLEALKKEALEEDELEEQMEEILMEAFTSAHEEVVALARRERFDAEASGACAVAAVWKGSSLWLAWAGDARGVIGSRGSAESGNRADARGVLAETTDHKPELPLERNRIEAAGGEVRSTKYADGWVSTRIYVRCERYPGLCMSRTLGDNCAKACGVIAEPEVMRCEINPGDRPFLVLASDGIWEFLDSKTVARNVAKELEKKGPELAVKKLQHEARKRWKKNEDDYCDDITTVLILLA